MAFTRSVLSDGSKDTRQGSGGDRYGRHQMVSDLRLGKREPVGSCVRSVYPLADRRPSRRFLPDSGRYVLMAKKFNYGKKFKKNGRMVQYRYTNGRKSSKKLVPARKNRK